MANKTDLAVAQFIGFTHSTKGYDLISLIDSMGLTRNEWLKIRVVESSLFTENQLQEIDKHFDFDLKKPNWVREQFVNKN